VYGQTGDRLAYGNRLGLELLQETDRSNSRFESLEAALAAHQAETARKITALENEVRVLKLASDGYAKIRQRFLDVYRRDILKDQSAKAVTMIGVGNAAAHAGDAVIDAGLYINGNRKDDGLMVEIYGLDPAKIFLLS
jgi:hypothetical protein